MIREIYDQPAHPSITELLSYATSSDRVNQVYHQYKQEHNQHLYGFEDQGQVVGCIGIEINENHCEIKHIAVSPNYRGNGIASHMIHWIWDELPISNISAETDKDAVEFYRKYGFQIISLGEKYPGVERFLCQLER